MGRDASFTRQTSLLCWGWLAANVMWMIAYGVAVYTGRRYSVWCDVAYSNGDNGPFGYGAHAGLAALGSCSWPAGLSP